MQYVCMYLICKATAPFVDTAVPTSGSNSESESESESVSKMNR